MAEILLITAVFAAVGLMVGALAAALAGKGAEAAGMAALRPGIRSCVEAFLILVGFAVASSLYPAYRACSISPAQALRAV